MTLYAIFQTGSEQLQKHGHTVKGAPLIMISQPQAVTNVILEAVQSLVGSAADPGHTGGRS